MDVRSAAGDRLAGHAVADVLPPGGGQSSTDTPIQFGE